MDEDVEEPFEQLEYSLDTNSTRQGAEARICECVFLGRQAVLKERFNKNYRHPLLDVKLNKARTKAELRGIIKARELGVQCPAIFFVDREQNKIIMERIEGTTAKQWIEDRRSEQDFQDLVYSLGQTLGELIGKMHQGGLAHGDLTTSNVIMRQGNAVDPVFIDFGLSSQGKVNAEEKGVDLYVLERAITSTHVDCERMMQGVLEGYKRADAKQNTAVAKKLDEIRLRGRKRDMTG